MSIMIDTPEGIAYFRFLARRGQLKIETEHNLRSSGVLKIIKDVYGFPGKTRKAVLADMDAYVEAKDRLREVPEGARQQVHDLTQDLIDALTAQNALSQETFEEKIFLAEERGAISNGIRQAMSDLFYVAIIENNAGNR